MPDCFDFSLFNLPQINLEITENINDKLVLKTIDENSVINFTYTYSIKGAMMEMVIEKITPEDVIIDIYTFTESTENLDVLISCP